MPDESKPAPKVALGDPLSMEQLDRLTHFSQGDLEDAKARFRKDAPVAFRSLLDAPRGNDDA